MEKKKRDIACTLPPGKDKLNIFPDTRHLTSNGLHAFAVTRSVTCDFFHCLVMCRILFVLT